MASVLEMLRAAYPSFEVEWENAAAVEDDEEPEVRSRGRARRAEGRPSAGSARPGGTAGRSRQGWGPKAPPLAADPVLLRSYAQLGLPVGANLAAARSAWRRLVRKFHPDLHASEPELEKRSTERIKEINHAYEVLRKRLGKLGKGS